MSKTDTGQPEPSEPEPLSNASSGSAHNVPAEAGPSTLSNPNELLGDTLTVPAWETAALGCVIAAAPILGRLTASWLCGAAGLLLLYSWLRRSAQPFATAWFPAFSWAISTVVLWHGAREGNPLAVWLAFAAVPVGLALAWFVARGRRSPLPPELLLALLFCLVLLAMSMLVIPRLIPGELIERLGVELLTPRALSDAWLLLCLLGVVPLLIRGNVRSAYRLHALFAAGLFLLIAVGGFQVGRTGLEWFRASSAEREVGRAREARNRYTATLEQWKAMGLAERGTWLDTALRRRIAVTGLDAGQVYSSLLAFPPSRVVAGPWDEFAWRTWNGRALSALAHARCLSAPYPPGLYVDFEVVEHPEGIERYAMDRWGRVWRLEADLVRRVWQPEPLLPGTAQDMERLGDDWIVLASDGRILCPKGLDWLQLPSSVRLSPEHRAVQLELLPTGRGALLATSHGQVLLMGESTVDLPLAERPIFPQPNVVDLELDRGSAGYYILDRYGAIHANGVCGLPTKKRDVPNAPYWQDAPIALDVELAPGGNGFYLLNLHGELYPVTPNPTRRLYKPTPLHPNGAVGLAVSQGDTPLVLLANGAVQSIP